MYTNFLLASTIGLATLAVAKPVSFPLDNGFPTVANPSDTLTQIELAAHGSLPNGAPPNMITDDTLNSLRFIAFNEIFEVAFFSELIYNITSNVQGYEIKDDYAKKFILNALTAVLAQEELHALNANGAATKFGGQPIQPCQYNFPVSSFEEAIALASTFTDVVLGTLQDITTLLGTNGDAGLIRGVASVIGQEGEQNGYYRSLLGKIPSSLPFLTASTREIAFSAINQGFVVPHSCPNSDLIKLPVFTPLTVETTNIQPHSQNLKFSIEIPSSLPSDWYSKYGQNYEKVSLVYLNQQNKPVYEKPEHINVYGNKVEFEALFPFDGTTFGNGLTIALLAVGEPASSAPEVTKNTVAGPGLIEIN